MVSLISLNVTFSMSESFCSGALVGLGVGVGDGDGEKVGKNCGVGVGSL